MSDQNDSLTGGTHVPSHHAPTSQVGLVQALSPGLSGKQRAYLRSTAHAQGLKPIVQVGRRGVTDALVENFEAALLAHELVKVKINEGDDMAETAEQLHRASGAQLAQKIGHILLFYRPHPEKPVLVLPK